jgi:small GTP-binding protein
MTTYDRKVCMLGAAEVGKTSLVRRFVDGRFSDRYQSTIGVKVDRRTVPVGADRLNLLLWDIEGVTAHRSPPLRYLRGAAGYLLVADGTKASTLETARSLHAKVSSLSPGLPFLLLLNKSDLAAEWALDSAALDALEAAGWRIGRTSALTGEGVAEAFEHLAHQLRPLPT